MAAHLVSSVYVVGGSDGTSRLKVLSAGHEKLDRQAEAGELLGLQRLYVCTALSSQPNGGLAEPLRVCSNPSLCLAWRYALEG